VPDIQIYDYQKGKDLVYDTPESPSVELIIDKGKHFNFTCDDVDAFQADIDKLNEWSEDASEQMKIAIDREVLGVIFADADPANQGANAGKISGGYNLGAAGAPVGLTVNNITDYIVHLGTVLDEQDVPEQGRWVVLPSWATDLVKRSKLQNADLSGDETSILRNGRMGMIDRFVVYRSNLLSSASETAGLSFNIMAGHKTALTFASQMAKLESLRNPQRFGDLMRGLNVYGFEVIKPEALVHLYAYNASV